MLLLPLKPQIILEMLRVLFISFFLVPLGLLAQYTTPGASLDLSFDDLVELSSGTVLADGDEYHITANLTIAATDNLITEGLLTVKLDPGVLITVFGGLLLNVEDGSVFTVSQSGNNYTGFRFEDGSVANLQNTIFEYGSGIRVFDCEFLMNNCEVRYQEIANSTGGALGLSTGKPIITNTQFTNNVRSAINSAANAQVAPLIENCYFFNNVTENSNRPQINLGPSGAADTTIIRGNTLAGNPDNIMVGGIAFTSLLGTQSHGIIENNYIHDNRYGITATGNNLYTLIAHNNIINNNTQNEPMLGGSGINIYSTAANLSTITGNYIAGNLWGITLQENAMANIGDTSAVNFNLGANIFDNNGNEGEIYALYNNTSNPVNAMNNCWMIEVMTTPELAESVIFHFNDDPLLGLVQYLPQNTCITVGLEEEITEVSVVAYPNPFSNELMIQSPEVFDRIQVFNTLGQVMVSEDFSPINQFGFSTINWPTGVYFINLDISNNKQTIKVVKQ
jgi:hypothetical protein